MMNWEGYGISPSGAFFTPAFSEVTEEKS